MDIRRREILPNIYMTSLRTDKFKTGCLSATLLTQLDAQTASYNALLPSVLRRGTVQSPDRTALQARLDELYGSSVEPSVRKKGEIQCVGFRAAFCDDRFLPGRSDVSGETMKLLGELLLRPNTRGGLLQSEYVDSEGQKLVERIDSLINDKLNYALHRMLANMCCCEAYGTSALGSRENAENIYYVHLSRHYKNLLSCSPVELFYCGSQEAERMEEAAFNAFVSMPRGEMDEELGTDIRMNTLEAQPRVFEEELDVAQGQLVLGFRLGSAMEEPDSAVLRVLNTIYGGGVTSKLFANVREKLSLCYYAGSYCDLHKGILAAYAGVDFDKLDVAREEILSQWEQVRCGNISADELESAKRYAASSLRSLADSPVQLEDFYLDQCVQGLDYGPYELAALVEDVTLEEVVEAAQDVQCDAIYTLRGKEVENDG